MTRRHFSPNFRFGSEVIIRLKHSGITPLDFQYQD